MQVHDYVTYINHGHMSVTKVYKWKQIYKLHFFAVNSQ